jgi:hypothetical protein
MCVHVCLCAYMEADLIDRVVSQRSAGEDAESGVSVGRWTGSTTAAALAGITQGFSPSLTD